MTAPNKCLASHGGQTIFAMLTTLSVHLQRIIEFIAEIPTGKVKDHGVLPLIPTKIGNVAIFLAR